MPELFARLLRSPQGAIGLALVAFAVLTVAIGPTIAPHAPEGLFPLNRYKAPSAAFWLGTDQYGRDIMSRLLYGARATVVMAVLATALGTMAGAVIGTTSAYLGGRADEAIMRTIDAIMSVPSLLFALLIVNLLGKSSVNALVAVAIAFTPAMARISRSVALTVRKQDYINAAVARGEGAAYVVIREMLPNVVAPIVVEMTIRVSFAVMLFATLSFLGLGAQPPAAEWGLMVSEARRFMHLSAWMIIWPSLAIALVAIGFNLLGDGLRDALDPHMTAILDIAGYTLDYALPKGSFRALEDVNLAIASGEALGLVGESGSGKTSLAWAIMRYLPGNAREAGGAIRLNGEDLRAKSPSEITEVRGRRIGMVFQDPSTSLNPTLPLGKQLAEVLVRHRGLTLKQAWAEGEAMMARVGLRRPADMMHRYPHEASGGEKQRVVIATAFACQPECILFDEPTTALDVITARQILDLFRRLQEETAVASLYISHDLAVVASVADRVAVIHRGRVVETAPVARIFVAPQADYTKRLIAAVPRPDRRLSDPAAGGADTAPLIEARSVTVRYGQTSVLKRLFGWERERVVGNRAVSLSVHPGEILGVVGESGSGKSTLAKALTGLNPFDGEILFAGRRIASAADMDRAYRRNVQLVFQNPDSSLNPRQRIGEILSRPLKLYGGGESIDFTARIEELLEQVRLPKAFARRFPHQLSGGEKQRVAIARAFASHPKLVICDEITSSLDVSVQAAVIELLIDLQRRFGTAYLFITHDLNLVRQIAHRIAVMFRGELVEMTTIAELAAGPKHPYTSALIDAVPAPVG